MYSMYILYILLNVYRDLQIHGKMFFSRITIFDGCKIQNANFRLSFSKKTYSYQNKKKKCLEIEIRIVKYFTHAFLF